VWVESSISSIISETLYCCTNSSVSGAITTSGFNISADSVLFDLDLEETVVINNDNCIATTYTFFGPYFISDLFECSLSGTPVFLGMPTTPQYEPPFPTLDPLPLVQLCCLSSTSDQSDGISPTSDGISPTSDGISPTSDGISPTSDGISPTSDQSDGISPTSDGISPTSDGISPTSDGISPTSDGISPTSDGISPTSDGISPTSDQSDGISPTSDGLSVQSDGLSDGPPTCCDFATMYVGKTLYFSASSLSHDPGQCVSSKDKYEAVYSGSGGVFNITKYGYEYNATGGQLFGDGCWECTGLVEVPEPTLQDYPFGTITVSCSIVDGEAKYTCDLQPPYTPLGGATSETLTYSSSCFSINQSRTTIYEYEGGCSTFYSTMSMTIS
jgi:hypothetical protein